jgi:hypothetical protein
MEFVKMKIRISLSINLFTGYMVAQLVEALRYKPEGRGFSSRWCHWILRLRRSRGSVLAFGTQVRGVRTRPKPSDF